ALGEPRVPHDLRHPLRLRQLEALRDGVVLDEQLARAASEEDDDGKLAHDAESTTHPETRGRRLAYPMRRRIETEPARHGRFRAREKPADAIAECAQGGESQ